MPGAAPPVSGQEAVGHFVQPPAKRREGAASPAAIVPRHRRRSAHAPVRQPMAGLAPVGKAGVVRQGIQPPRLLSIWPGLAPSRNTADASWRALRCSWFIASAVGIPIQFYLFEYPLRTVSAFLCDYHRRMACC